MAFKDYIPVSEKIAEIFGSLSGLRNRILDLQPVLAGPNIYYMPNPGASCSENCSGTCSATCTTTCASSCAATCSNNCTGDCTSTCRSGCTGNCAGDCKTGCTGNCYGDCKSQCSNYCKNICQTYCEKQQTWSLNTASNHPSGSGRTFYWSSTVAPNATINISAADWNILAGYIEAAGPYCGSTPSIERAVSGAPITAQIFNSLNSGLSSVGGYSGAGIKTADVDIIYASEINALASAYNSVKIKRGLPANSTGQPNLCCQKSMFDHQTHQANNSSCPVNHQLGEPRYGL